MLDLLRHGEAERDGPQGDASRPLSPRGAAALRELGERLAAEDWRPRRAFSSRLLRARQSLEIVLVAAGVQLEPEVMAELAPEGEPAGLLLALEARGVTSGHAILVGHQPLLGDLAHYLCDQPVRFEPGTMAWLSCPSPPPSARGRSRLERLVHPGRP